MRDGEGDFGVDRRGDLLYLRNRAKVDAYLEVWRIYTERAWLEQQRTPAPEMRRLRELKARRAALQREVVPS